MRYPEATGDGRTAMIVYLVGKGEYSDYRICGVFSTPALADEACLLFATERKPREILVDEIPAHPPGLLPFGVYMLEDGHVRTVVRASIDDGEMKAIPNWHPSGAALPHSGYAPNYCTETAYWVWATDRKHAIKIANEQRAGLLARGIRPTSWADHARVYEGKA
jgi:hypothetical protein